ncbi:MAG: GAF domain-containing protein, partial [Cyanobacteria bacterium J06635_13]
RDVAGQVQEVVEVALDLTAMYEVQQKLAVERTSLLQASAKVANLLLRASDYTRVLPDVVRLLGEAVESDRCAIMQDIGLHPTLNKPAVRICTEWCRLGVSTSLKLTPPPEQAYLWDDVPEAYKTLSRGQVFNKLVADIKEPGRNLLQAQGNTSCLFVPILVEGNLWGLFSFDNCGEPKLYDDAEIAILQVAAETMAAAIARQTKDEELRESEHRYRTLFELSSEGILRFGYHQPIPLSLSVDEQLELCYQSVYIAEANDAYAKMFEYEKAKDMIGLTLNDVHDRNSEVTQITMREWIENRYTCDQLETIEFDRHGRKRYFLNSSVSTIEDDCVTSTWVSQVDITELREAQQALLEAEQERCLRLASQSQQLAHLNTQLQQTLVRLEERDRILAATAEASNILLTRKDFDESVNQALQIIGESINTDRIGIIENFDNPEDPLHLYWKMTYEWNSAYAVSQLNYLEVLQGSYEEIEEWDELLTQGESISCQLEELSEPFRSEMAKIGIKTLYVVPILIEGKY